MTAPSSQSIAGSSGSAEIWTYEPPRPGPISRILWWCAGADAQILARCTFAEQVKFASIGGFVVATGLLGTLTMWFAMLTVFKSIAVAAVIAPIWGAMIFNIDRFIVSSTGKGDGEETISPTEWFNALPRLIMAIAISLVISAPLETKIFERELDQWISEENSSIRNAERQRYQSAFASEEGQRNVRISQLQKEVSGFDSNIRAMIDVIGRERAGLNSKAGAGCKGICQGLQSDLEDLKRRREGLATELTALQREQKERLGEVETHMREGATALAARDGLLARVILAHDRAFWPCILITFVLICIECAPIIFKLMLVKGPYDYIEESVRDLIRAQEGIEITHRWQQVEGSSDGGRVVSDPPIYHRARLEAARQTEATDTQLAVERAAWGAYRLRLVASAEANPGQYFDEQPPVGTGPPAPFLGTSPGVSAPGSL